MNDDQWHIVPSNHWPLRQLTINQQTINEKKAIKSSVLMNENEETGSCR